MHLCYNFHIYYIYKTISLSPSAQFYKYCFMQLSFDSNRRKELQTKRYLYCVLYLLMYLPLAVLFISLCAFELLSSVLSFCPGGFLLAFIIGLAC